MGTQMKNLLTICFIFFGLYSFVAMAATPSQLTISQIDAAVSQDANNRTIKLYVNLLDRNNRPISNRDIDAQVTIDGQNAQVQTIKKFADTGEAIAYTFLLDISGTMKGEPFNNAIAAIKKLLEALDESNRFQQDSSNQHQVALITFGDEVTTVFDFTSPYELNKQLDEKKLRAEDDRTLLYAAILKAFELNKRNDETLPTRRAILVITDGKDEGSGIGLSDLNLDERDVPIYTIGYSRITKQYLDNLKGIAQLSDGTAYLQGDKDFLNIHREIQRQLVISVAVPKQIQVNSFAKNVQITITTNDKHSISEQKDAKFYIDSQGLPPTIFIFPEIEKEDAFWGGSFIILLIIFRKLLYKIYKAIVLLLFKIYFRIKNIIHFIEDEEKNIPANKQEEIRPYKLETTDVVSTKADTASELTATYYRSDVVEQATPSIRANIKITILQGKRTKLEKNYAIYEQGLTIGRASDNDICLKNDPKISRFHCRLHWKNSHLFVDDCESKNATFINGITFTKRHEIKDNDNLMVGDTLLRINILE